MSSDFASLLSNALYVVSAALLLPTLLALSGLIIATLLCTGGFICECVERWRVRAILRTVVSLLAADTPNVPAARAELRRAPSGPARRFSNLLASDTAPDLLQKTLDDVDAEISSHLGLLGFVARVGPMLGLMATLIPFGSALAGLSAGNVREISANLVTAFAGTVAGLVCGCAAHAIGVIRRGWYARDLNDLDFIVGRLRSASTAAPTAGNHVVPALHDNAC